MLHLLHSDVLIEQINVGLAQTLLLVLLPDQSCYVHISHIVHILLFVVIAGSVAQYATDWRHPVDLVLPLLTTVLISHSVARVPLITMSELSKYCQY